MRLGLVMWWCAVGVTGRAWEPPRSPRHRSPHDAQPQDILSHDTSTKDTPLLYDTHPQDTLLLQDMQPQNTLLLQDMQPQDTQPQDTLLLQDTQPLNTLQDKQPQDTPQHSSKTQQEMIHAEELLEKYGYLDCVPPGSENNARLHRLLLYRRQQNPTAPRYEPLDFRLLTPDTKILPQQTEYSVSGRHNVVRMFSGGILPQEDLQVLSVRQDLLSPPWSSRGRIFLEELGNDGSPTVAVWDPDTSQLHYLPVCTEAQIQQAVRKFQALYHVGAEGALDPATMVLLSSPRCGNPDTLMEPSTLTEEANSALKNPRLVRQRRRARRSKTDTEKNKQRATAGPTRNDGQNDATMDSSSESHDYIGDGLEDIMPDQELLRVTADELREATRSRHPPVEQHVEWEPHPTEAVRRRRRWVEDLVSRIHTGEEDARLATLTPHLTQPRTSLPPLQEPDHAQGLARGKRSTYSHLGDHFHEGLITWRLVTSGYSSQLGVGAQRASLALAFRMWSEVIPPVFLEDKVSPTENVNINIGFGKRSHLGCVTEFDGLGGELGHTLRPAQDAQIHMDDDEHFTLDSDHGTNLVKVAVHEIGHVLGLEHVVRNYSIMYPVYEKVLPNRGLELGWEDRKLVQRVYGACIGAFDTVLDLLRWRPDGSLTYNTYFFRREHYWMYENRYNRTRFGDPLFIQPEWRGLPDSLDGYAHIWTRTKDIHLFFKGDSYYVYDPVSGRVAAGYPRLIAKDFHGLPTSKRPLGRTIPSNIDSVYFDKRDENLYFFKGKKVYGYDVSKGSTGCCLPGYPRRIREEFTAADSSSRPLPRDLDAVYYSYTDQTLFFLKDRLFWELVTFHAHDQQRNNSVVGPFYVHHKWYDICDTELDAYNAYTRV